MAMAPSRCRLRRRLRPFWCLVLLVVLSLATAGCRGIHAFTVSAAVDPKPLLKGLDEDALKGLKAKIDAFASDLDGTLTRSGDKKISEETKRTVRECVEKGEVVWLPATGKTRKGFRTLFDDEKWCESLPGIFIQGLLVYGPNQEVIHERFLDLDVGVAVVEYCRERKISLLGYAGDRIITEKPDTTVEKLSTVYNEPFPERIGPLDDAMRKGLKVHKLILMTEEGRDEDVIASARADLKDILKEKGGKLTQAIPHMLEVFMDGESKAKGLTALLKHLKIDKENLAAIGDAENDVEMLEYAGLSIAMGNAEEEIKEKAHLIAPSNDEDGAALAMKKLLL